MKKTGYALLSAILLAGCMDGIPLDNSKPATKEWNDFSFSTVSQTRLAIDYKLQAEVYFEVYDQIPVAENAEGTSYIKKEGIEPIYAGYTKSDGRFSAQLELPSYLETAYIYTPAVYAQTLLIAEKNGDTLLAEAYVGEASATPASATRASYESVAVTKDGWKTWLGSYDRTYGRIDYAYTGTDLNVANWEALYKAASRVFNTDKSCPQEYRSSSDLYLEKDAEIAITYLMSNTCWNCSMGYYYYDASAHPTSLSDVHPVMIFPNTQDGQWSNNRKEASKYIGVNRGTAVQLMFYPNIAKGSKEGATNVFPKGYRVGFVLATNAWGNRLRGFGEDKDYRAATSSGLSINDNGEPFNQPRTAVYRYTNTALDLNSVICSFEDYTTDENFSDIIFTVKSNPVEAVVDIPSIEEKPGADDVKKEVRLLKGIYAFEDLWPSRGDYDMNDVLVKLNQEKTIGGKGLYEESFLLKTFNNYAGLDNGLAVRFNGNIPASQLEFSILRPSSDENTTPQYEPYTPAKIDGEVILLTDGVKKEMGATYKVTAKYASPIDETAAASIKPFLYSEGRAELAEDKRWEVHIPFEAPSDKMDHHFFGTGDDKSDPQMGAYYVRDNNYPFAIYLSGASETDLSKLLDAHNEKTPIDNLYPDYTSWVTSSGVQNSDWYK